MKIILRILGLSLAIASLCVLGMSGAAIATVGISLGGVIAFIVYTALTILWVRCGMWLWSERPFWKEDRRAAEVATAIAAFVAIGVVAQFEKFTSGALRATVQLGGVALVLSSYLVFRRIFSSISAANAKKG